MYELWTTEKGRYVRPGFVDRLRASLAHQLSRLAALVDAPEKAFLTLHRPTHIGTFSTEAACLTQANRLGLLDFEVFDRQKASTASDTREPALVSA